ncbi:glutathione S-transferase [Thalassotalea piscium]|uniref:Glutathione S-transferase n=1 Tax=Thalassotalea piscium TaxID=1230533 RepID=A0A7X0TTY0_9GAMM|nr:glutathione S-transferase [Thalassotalea piscium]MBB6543584.1 glutathione S-transferase [Thalassotalea piscium]
MTLPILYSLRNCPYAMRARIAIYRSSVPIELRDIVLKNKPKEMLLASPKGTVPTLVLPSGKVVDESLDVMLWALNTNDPYGLLGANKEQLHNMLTLIHRFDHEFKQALEQYKCAKRYHEANIEQCREKCELYIQEIEQRLNKGNYLINTEESLADIAILPFIRQFARVERQWYLQSPYPNLKKWLKHYLQSAMFTKVMAKYPLWKLSSEPVIFSGSK